MLDSGTEKYWFYLLKVVQFSDFICLRIEPGFVELDQLNCIGAAYFFEKGDALIIELV